MKTSGKININVPRTVENAVNGRQDFHFYVDELTSENYMPTYAGMADEKYGFDFKTKVSFFLVNKARIGRNTG